ncbi:MAG: hypothetical protein ACYCPW_10750 [Nitrososphaerales archaeon]
MGKPVESKGKQDEEKVLGNSVESVEAVQEEPMETDTLTESIVNKPSPRVVGRQFKNIDEGRRTTLGVGLPAKLIDQVVELADSEDIPRSEVITRAVRAYLQGASLEKLQDAEIELKAMAKVAVDRLTAAKSRGATLLANLPILQALDDNDFNGEYACDGLGKTWKALKPIHPHILTLIKAKLGERDGKYSNDYERFLELVAEAEGLTIDETRQAIDEAIKADKVFGENVETSQKEDAEKTSEDEVKENPKTKRKKPEKQDTEDDDDWSGALGL